MLDQFKYNSDQRTFSSTKDVRDFNSKEIIKLIGISAALHVIPAVIKAITKRQGAKRVDEILTRRNDRLNRLSDNYNVEGIGATADPDYVRKYNQELHALYQDTLAIMKSKRSLDYEKNPDIYINVNQDQYGSTRSVSKMPVEKENVLYQYINPFIAVLKMVCVRGLHVLPGTMMGADRRNFELVYDSEKKNSEDVIRDNFRNTVFKYPWPSHGFEVSTRGAMEANKLISETFDFLAHNPKFLAIRVK